MKRQRKAQQKNNIERVKNVDDSNEYSAKHQRENSEKKENIKIQLHHMK